MVRCVCTVRHRKVAWTRSSSARCSWIGEDLHSLGGTAETSVLSRATENFRDAPEEARGGADSCSPEVLRKWYSAEFRRNRVRVGPRSPTTVPEALETNGKPPETDSHLPRVFETQPGTANTQK